MPAQVCGCVLGAVIANAMFAKAPISISTHHRSSPAHLLAEAVATLGLILVIFAPARTHRTATAPAAVGAYIGAAYFSPARAASRTPRSRLAGCSPTRSPGSRPASAPTFILAQTVGGGAAFAAIRVLYPHVTAREAAMVVVPHPS